MNMFKLSTCGGSHDDKQANGATFWKQKRKKNQKHVF